MSSTAARSTCAANPMAGSCCFARKQAVRAKSAKSRLPRRCIRKARSRCFQSCAGCRPGGPTGSWCCRARRKQSRRPSRRSSRGSAVPLFDGPAFKIDTNLLGVDTSTWIAADGRPVFELALHGTMISSLETEPQAKSYLVAASLNKDETLLEFSLLRTDPIDAPQRVSRLEIELSGVPTDLTVPSSGQQICVRELTRLRCTVDRAVLDNRADSAQLKSLLLPTLQAPSTDGQIVELARSIAGDAKNVDERLQRILAWIDTNIAKEAIDAFTAVDVLRERRGECQGTRR
jgi:hypothetical protein